ncbi:hypothetical protein VaNZ11_004520 [Volvox africanus]|uniref:ZIP family transporter n=1 Tax=Volvox africanus TaxID=51714 RepID=A0ABQ5RY25_9CHLO|nr:hypothetical protein VaNZ11_004520 [Volvox africanus]
MLPVLVFCLLAASSSQARHVHVQGDGLVDRHKLIVKDHEQPDLEQGIDRLRLPLPILLQRCLADAACSDALAADAAIRLQQRKENLVEDVMVSSSAVTQQELHKDARAHHATSDTLANGPTYRGGDLDRIRSKGGGRDGGAGISPDSGDTSGVGLALRRVDGGLWSDGTEGVDGGEQAQAGLSVKGLAALALFLEAVAGMYLPLLLQRLQSPQWWLSLLNCFSGGIFLSAGIIHLLPHCAEAQEALGPIGPNGGDYPLYLVLVVVGYCVVFYVERVLFDVHGEGHAHCQHSNVYSHSSYYKQLSHRNQRHAVMPAGTSAAPEPELLLLPGPAVANAGHACRGVDIDAETAETVAALGDDECEKKEVLTFQGTQTPSGGLDDRVAPHHDHHDHHDHHGHHGHSHLQPHQHATQSRSQSNNHVGRLPLPTVPNAGSDLQAGVPVGFVGVGLGLDGNVVEEDAESCHSDHPPRAICMCVEEEEAKADARGQHHHNHKQQQQQLLHRGGADRSQHSDQPGQGSISHAHCHGRGGSAGGCFPLVVGNRRGSAGGGECDERLRTPLLAAHAALVPTPPALPAQDGACGFAGDIDGAKAIGELGGMPWQHVQQQQQQQHLLVLPLHPPESCVYHTRHHLHPHHRPRRRSMGPGPVSGCGVGAVDSCASSSCASLVQTLDPHPTSIHAHPNSDHPHTHDHHHHHHVIKPRFRFMHGVVLLVALALHTSLECIALGLIDSRAEFLLLFAAIASHKAVSALALSSRFMREGATMAQVTVYVGPFCLVAPVSILAGVYVGRVAPIARLVFSCFATGTFIYVGASEVIMEEFEGEMRADRRDISTRAARYIKFSAVLLAVALVAASGLLPDPDHH